MILYTYKINQQKQTAHKAERETIKMKKYAFYTQNGYGAEKFYFKDERENTVIVLANSWEEAEEKIKNMLDNPKDFEEDGFTAEEVTENNEWKSDFENTVYWGDYDKLLK